MNFPRAALSWLARWAMFAAALTLGAKPPVPASNAADRVVTVEDFDHDLLAREIFRETNDVRARAGVPRLKLDAQLVTAANNQASMLAIRIHSGHDNPLANQGDPTARVNQTGLPAGTVAENAASVGARNPAAGHNYTYRELAAVIVQAWMDSPGHRANLLNPTLHFLGCGTRAASMLGNPTVYAIQDFYTPAPQSEPSPPVVMPGGTSIAH